VPSLSAGPAARRRRYNPNDKPAATARVAPVAAFLYQDCLQYSGWLLLTGHMPAPRYCCEWCISAPRS